MDFLLKNRLALAMAGLLSWAIVQPALAQPAPAGLRIATFESDATPPIGYDMGYSVVKTIGEPLRAKGVVILGAGRPIIMMAVDWVNVDSRTRDEWHAQLAKAAGTTPDRVSVHALHQHDAPRGDLGVFEERVKIGLPIGRG